MVAAAVLAGELVSPLAIRLIGRMTGGIMMTKTELLILAAALAFLLAALLTPLEGDCEKYRYHWAGKVVVPICEVSK